MNLQTPLHNILFLDIETVPEKEHWNELSETTQELFAKKTAYQRKEDISAEDFYERAGIWAEFGKIICISVAFFNPKISQQLRVTSFYGEDEKQILQEDDEQSKLLAKSSNDDIFKSLGINVDSVIGQFDQNLSDNSNQIRKCTSSRRKRRKRPSKPAFFNQSPGNLSGLCIYNQWYYLFPEQSKYY